MCLSHAYYTQPEPHTPPTPGLLFARAVAKGADGGGGGGSVSSPSRPAVVRDDGESSLNLKDPWARVYLARGCATALQSGHIAGGSISRAFAVRVFSGGLEGFRCS